MTKSDPLHAIEALARGAWGDPFAALGPHLERRGGRMHLVIRTCQPAAARVHVLRLDGLASDEGVAMERRHPAGIFEAAFEDVSGPFPYRLRLTWPDGSTSVADDPYRFGQILGSLDMHLLGEGRHYRSWEKLGAHVVTVDGVAGTYFAVWAPSAQRVSVVGDFNGWDGRVHPMRLLVPNGIWELFIPGVAKGAKYKFEIRTHGGAVFLKADPYARYFEVPPATAAVVWDSAGYAWSDAGWMAARRTWDAWLHRPMATYEVHLGSWARGEGGRHLTYRELAGRLVPYVKDLGFTHLELMPVLEHPFDGSWGYQVTGFFAPTSRFGPPEDFKLFVDECHRQGLGVVLDWVPGHFPKDAHALARFDGTALYEHADPRQGEHTDWGTLIFNYGRNEVRNFLLSSALFWLDEFHLDGLRVDAVASMLYLDYSRTEGQWIPNKYGGRENLEAVDFLRQLNELTHAEHPGTITVAEESTAWPAVSRPVYLGGLGFTYKWNMGWMHDMLLYCTKDPVFRRWEHNKVTFSLLYAWNENFILPFSHDEVVHMKGSMLNKMPGDTWQKAANLRTLYAYMFSHPGKKLLFMGDELGQWTEWSEKASLPWDVLEHPPHQGLLRFVRDLAGLYQRQPSLYDVDFEPSGFEWIDCNDNENSVFAFFRRARDPHDIMVVVLNFTPVARHGYRLGVPFAGHYAELLNSDAQIYGGSNIGNAGGVDSEGVPHHGRPQSLELTLPPLGAIYLKWQWPPDVGAGPTPA